MSAITLTKTFTATATLGAWVTALKAAGAGIGRRVPVPILAGVKLHVVGGVVQVSRYDYEVHTFAEVSGSMASGGDVLVDHKMFLDLLVTAGKRATKRISDGWTVDAYMDGHAFKIDVNGSTFTMSTLPEEEFPVRPMEDAEAAFSVDAATFIRRMDSALVAVSTDDTLPILTGIKMEIANRELSLLATDRYRLVVADMPVNTEIERSFLLKAKVWAAFKKVLNAKGEPIVIRFDDRHIAFRQGALELTALGLDGDFPRIRSLFPDSTEIQFEMDADLLAAHVKTVSVTAERNTPVRFTYNGIDSLRVDAGTGENVQAQAFMPYTSEHGNRGFSVAFNPHYLLEALKDFKGETVRINHTSAPKPAQLSSADSNQRHLIMPVRLPSA